MGQPVLNMQAFQNSKDDNKYKLWLEGVSPTKISKKPGEAIWIKILPSFVFGEDGAPVAGSKQPCRTIDGQPTAWGSVVFMCNYVGYGSPGAGGVRRDFVGMNTFGPEERCLLSEVVSAAYNDQENWGFLVGSVYNASAGKWERTRNREEEMLKRPAATLFVNAVVYDDREGKTQLMYMSKSAATAFFAPGGLLNQPNTAATDEGVAADFNSAYASGDFTDVNTGAVLNIQRENKPDGGINGYTVNMAITQPQGKAPTLVGLPIVDAQLEQRYNLADPTTFLKKPTHEKVIQDLCAVCNRWSPDGKRHPYELFKQLFGAEFNIPAVPEKPYSRVTTTGAVTTPGPAGNNAMSAAFGGPPAAVAIPVANPVATVTPTVIDAGSLNPQPEPVKEIPTKVTPTVIDAGSLNPQPEPVKEIPVQPVNTGTLPSGLPGGAVDADAKAAFMADVARA